MMQRLVIAFVFLFLLSFVNARVVEIPMDETTEIVAMTHSVVRVIPDGTEPYDFQTGECVEVAPSNNYADYTILNDDLCTSLIFDQLLVEARISWLTYDYVCDGCTQWTSGLLGTNTLGIIIEEVPTGDGTEEDEEEEPP